MRNSAIVLRGTEIIQEQLYNRKVQKYTGTAIEWQETEHTWIRGLKIRFLNKLRYIYELRTVLDIKLTHKKLALQQPKKSLNIPAIRRLLFISTGIPIDG